MKHNLKLVILFILMLAACTPASPTATPTIEPTPAPKRIALVMKTLTNPFFIEMERGARQAQQELGIELIVRTAAQETSIEQQIEIIEQLTREAVDAIVIAPGDSRELIPALKAAQAAGIIIVNIDNRLDPAVSAEQGLQDVPFISVDNVQGAYLAGKYLSARITTPTEAIILEGIRTAQNAQDRRDGAAQAFAENANITLVAQETANWKIDEAYTVTETLLAEHPDVKLIFAANDMMALGAIQYLQETGKTDVLVGGYDALTEALAAIEAGTLAVTIDQQAALQGYEGVITAMKLLNGETVEPLILVDVKVIGNEE
jgi:ribose transport system substrate-binding protein